MRTNASSPALSRADRLIRGWIVAAGANLLGVASHGLAGGNLPHPLLWLLYTAISAVICVGLAGRRLSRLNMMVSVLLAQGLLHFLYMNSSPSAQVPSGHPSGIHAHGIHTQQIHATAIHSQFAHHHETLTLSMVGLHLLAAALTYIILRWGETLSERIVKGVVHEIQTWFVFPILPIIPRTSLNQSNNNPGFSLIQRVLAEVRLERGPPQNIAP